MAPRDDDLSFLSEAARRAIAQQRACHDQLGRQATRRRGAGLVQHLEATLGAIERHIVRSEARYRAATSDVERDTALSTLRLLNGFLGQMQEANAWLEAAGNQRLGVGSVRLVDECAAALIGDHADVVTVPRDDYGYATMWSPFTRILRYLQAPAPAVHPVVLFYPSQESMSLLLEPLFVHELGHSLVVLRDLVGVVLAQREGRRTFNGPRSRATRELTASGISRRAARITLDRNLRRWLTEYLCDTVGAAYAGPAYLYAFAAVVASTSSVELQDSHPPTALRLRLLLKHLERGGWMPLLRHRTPKVLEWIEYLASRAPTVAEPGYRFLIDVTEQFTRPMWDEVVQVMGASTATPTTFDVEDTELAEFLRHRILPAQLRDGRAAERRNIVLSGWLHVLSSGDEEGREADEASAIPRGVSNEEFAVFLDKAVEMSSVLESWRRG